MIEIQQYKGRRFIKMKANEFKNELVEMLIESELIYGIGQTGDLNAPLIPGKSDIDLFVLCKEVPSQEERLKMYAKLTNQYDSLSMQVCAGGIWGYGDIFLCDGIDVMPMYFTIDEMREYVEEVLAGKHLEKEGRFYPIGRLASIETIHVLYDKEQSWDKIISLVKTYPEELFKMWYQSEICRVVDEEDLSRATLRHEVLFYHQVVEEFLDHFLQALYAKNKRYFPSRKRTEKAITEFKKKPDQCYERLLKVVELGAKETTIEESVEELRKLCEELRNIPW